MKSLIVILALGLSACVSVPVERKFPKPPEELMIACPDLQTITTGTTQLSIVVEAVTTNYGQYQLCQTKNDTWIDWYNRQKEIFDSVK
jgi:starvation-inducible outer membrane lipoprotein